MYTRQLCSYCYKSGHREAVLRICFRNMIFTSIFWKKYKLIIIIQDVRKYDRPKYYMAEFHLFPSNTMPHHGINFIKIFNDMKPVFFLHYWDWCRKAGLGSCFDPAQTVCGHRSLVPLGYQRWRYRQAGTMATHAEHYWSDPGLPLTGPGLCNTRKARTVLTFSM